ncbi:hypothetical protein MRX96_027527 [Rhipicephalus microplus]
MCGWTNHTDTAPTTNLVGRVGSAPRDSLTWRLASVVSRPANLQDHTYRAPTGYIFFDIFNQNSVQNPVLRSSTIPALEGQAERCLSFWFAPFGRGESSTLSVFQAPEAPPSGRRWRHQRKRSRAANSSVAPVYASHGHQPAGLAIRTSQSGR